MNPFDYNQGELYAEQVPIGDIVKAVGTPSYVYSHQKIVQQWRAFDSAFGTHPHRICYAVKANSNLAVLNTLATLGSGFDIVSQGELARVLAAKGDPKKVVFSGIGKQPEEMAFALKSDIFCFNVESEQELLQLNQVAAYLNKRAPIAFRVNPDVDPKSHPYISTGLKENKFGINIEHALSLYQKATQLSHIEVQGLACHIGSQLTSMQPFADTFKRLFSLAEQLKSAGIMLSHIDVGGGLGVDYQNETPPTPQEYVDNLLTHCHNPNCLLVIEPGRAITANAGILVTQVLALKQSGDKRFCIVDCAMNDLIRPTLYGAWQKIISVKEHHDNMQVYDIVGPICESGDFLGTSRELHVKVGDHLAILGAGAYGFVMSSNYNSRPRAPEVYVKDKAFKVVRSRETIEELYAKETLW